MLTAEDIQSWPLDKVTAEVDRRFNELRSIREKNGGTLVGLGGADAEAFREHDAALNLLGERRDELKAQTDGEERFTKLSDYLTKPAGHPGHGSGNGKPAPASATRDIGGLFVESEAFRAFREAGALDRPVTVPIASLWPSYKGIGEVPSRDATLFDSSGFPIQPQFLAEPIQTLYQRNNIGPLMGQGTTNSNTLRYPVETVTATGAAAVAESGTKPEAALSFAATDEPVRKIAVILPLTDESLEDVPMLQAYINARLRLFVQNEEDRELLVGSGTAPEIKGLMNRSGINTSTSYSIGGSNADQALVDAVFHAAMRVRDAFVEPEAVVLKPSTWEIAALAKDANRNYLLGGPGMAGYVAGTNDPRSGAGPRLWGMQVVLNSNMPAQSATNKVALVGAFSTCAMVVRRSGIDLAISDSHSTYFYENKIALRAEERLALAVWRPAGFATVTSAA